MAEPRSVIEMSQVSKTFDGITAVRDVTLNVYEGEIFGFIGPSGCGKTTTIRMLCGVYRPSDGLVRVLGKQPEEFDQNLRARIGYMPQLFALYPTLSVRENLDFAASIYGVGWRSRRKQRTKLLEFVELQNHQPKLVRDISGGMQRRLVLACSLMHNPSLIFLDEPTAGIDPILRAKFWEGFRNLKAEGRTLFVTTQYVTESEYCDRVAIMNDGRLIALDTPHNLRKSALGGEVVLATAKGLGYRHQKLFECVPGFKEVKFPLADNARLVVEDASVALPHVVNAIESAGMIPENVEEYNPPFDAVFVALVEKERGHA
ncbi:MAG: hypothetical protein A2Z04_09735 [Chloroflexi bacterium RBG_16_57_9]|nr:MAG: hypothetical protein A2Z04_09735 [Chloroflexi bacterium RBG_16_57_9]